MSEKFIPMYDLDRLSKDELYQYYINACAFHGVPPELNVLAFTLMDSGDGARRKVLYAKKGATDIIRERLGISVVDLRKETLNGTLVYTCLGKNKDGRTEIAVGASFIEGLSGRTLEIAIMVAQTRAVRRMTLQFAGAGLLDETELQADSKTIDIKEALTAPQPTVKPNTAPGKDITPTPNITPEVLKAGLEITQNAMEFLNETLKDVPTPAQLEAQIALSKVPTGILVKEARETPGEAPKRRSRPNKPIELDAPFLLEAPIVDNTKSVNADIPESKRTAPFVRIVEPILAPPASHIPDTPISITPTSVPELPSPEQMKVFKDKLFVYTNEILPGEGRHKRSTDKMTTTENIGGPAIKVRLFAQAKYKQLNQLTVSQWEEMFKLFESMSAPDLVRLIDETAIKAKA